MAIFGAFFAADINSHLRTLRNYVKTVEADITRFDEGELIKIKDVLMSYAISETNKLFENYVQNRIRPRIGNDPVPSIFKLLKDRSINSWEQSLNKGFVVAARIGQKHVEKLTAEIKRQIRKENERRRLLAIKRGRPEPKPQGGILGFILNIFGLNKPKRQGRKVNLGLVPYVKLLFKTIPDNLERDLTKFFVRFYIKNKVFKVVGGIVHNSASTCRWCNEKVIDLEALEFVTESKELSVHLFHPNCRHRIVPVSDNFSGKVFGIKDLPTIVNKHFAGFNK